MKEIDSVLTAEKITALEKELAEQKARAERAECQLAGCGAAALGYGGECQKGDYGWTPAFDDIVSLRDKWLAEKARAEESEERIRELGA